MNSRSITDYILKLEKENEQLKKDLLESEIQRVSTTLNEADESRTKIEQLKKLYTRAEEEKVNALNELNDLKYKNRSYTETTARVLHKCVNHGLVDRMLELGNMTSDYHKTMTYQKAAETISQLDYEVESGESLLQYPGIGKGIAAKIDEYLDEQDSDYEESECSDSESIASNDDDSRCAYAPATPDDEGSFVSDTDDEGEESDDEEFFVSFNADLCDMLHNLADETDDKFKRKAYIRAANSVYELPYKITSGKAISQGPNKVPGVGKSIAAKIDDFLAKTKSVNGALANCFIKLGNLEEPVYKSEAYWNAADKLRELSYEVSCGNDVRHLKGFGPSICSKIDEFLETGKIARLEELS
jgi:DNA polymerase/3'-5' exonuclease PolX